MVVTAATVARWIPTSQASYNRRDLMPGALGTVFFASVDTSSMQASSTVTEQVVWLDAATVAELVGVSVFTVRRRARDGQLPAMRFEPRGHLRFRADVIDDLISGRSSGREVDPDSRGV